MVGGVKWRWVILVLVGCLAVVAAVVAVWRREKEPEYRGKKLSEWVEVYYSSAAQNKVPYSEGVTAEDAIRQIGTNGLPWLLKWVRRRPPPRIGSFVYPKLPKKFQNDFTRCHLGLQLKLTPWMASYGFQALGPAAEGAVPELLQMLREAPPNVFPRFEIRLCALCSGRTNSISTFITVAAATNEPSDFRVRAVMTLGEISRHGNDAAIAGVERFLADADPAVRSAAQFAKALVEAQMLGTTAVRILLRETLNDPDPKVRQAAAAKLQEIDPGAVL